MMMMMVRFTLFCAVILAKPFDRPGHWKLQEFPNPMRDALFFKLVGTVHHSRQLGHVVIRVPVRAIVQRASEVLNVTGFAMGPMQKRLTDQLRPKWKHLQSSISAFEPFKVDLVDDLMDSLRFTRSTSAFQDTRFKRSLNVDLNPTSAIKAIFSGINSLINAPTNKQIQDTLGKLVHSVEDQQVFLNNLGNKTEHALVLLRRTYVSSMSKIDQLQEQTRISDVLDVASTSMDLLLECATEFARGRLCHIITPSEIHQALAALQVKADRTGGLKLILGSDTPLDIYSMPATIVTTDLGDWDIVVHIPLVEPEETYFGYWFLNIPFLGYDDNAAEFVTDSGLLAITSGLDADRKHIFVSEKDYENQCMKILEKIVCINVVIYRGTDGTCPGSLFTTQLGTDDRHLRCEIRPAPKFFQPVAFGNSLILFSTNQTEISITCGNDQPRLVVFSGRHVESLDPGCKVVSNDFIYFMPTVHDADSVLTEIHFNLIQMAMDSFVTQTQATIPTSSMAITVNGSLQDELRQDLIETNTLLSLLENEINENDEEFKNLWHSQTEQRKTLMSLMDEMDDHFNAYVEYEDLDDDDIASLGLSTIAIIGICLLLWYVWYRSRQPIQHVMQQPGVQNP